MRWLRLSDSMIKNLKNMQFLNEVVADINENAQIFNQEEIDFYKSCKLFSDLNLSDKEIKENLIYLDEALKIHDECLAINDFCSNQSGYHINVKRVKGRIFFFASPCKKMLNLSKATDYKKNFLYNYYQFSDISNARINYENIGKSVTKTKGIIISFFRQCLESKNISSSYIYGKCHVGKTFLSLAFANEIADILDKKICFVYMPDFVNTLKSGFNNPDDNKKANDIYSYMKTADFLCIDDLGAEYATEWFYSNYLLNVLNIRMSEKKPTLFNSNSSLDELRVKMVSRFKSSDKNIIVERIIDRIKTLVGNNTFLFLNSDFREKDKSNDK